MAEIFKLFQKADVLVLATPVYFYRYRGTPQGSVLARDFDLLLAYITFGDGILTCMSLDFGKKQPV